MILGMNPKALRQKRLWETYLWPKQRHWALVIRPAGEKFHARISDDFADSPTHCFCTEIDSESFFLVYEVLVEDGGFLMQLSAKPDFATSRGHVQMLGKVGPLAFEDIESLALAVVRRYKGYSIIGCNCQHFVAELAVDLGVPIKIVPKPEDMTAVRCAGESAAAVSAAGATVAAGAIVTAMGTSLVGSGTMAAASATPTVLAAVAFGGSVVGLLGGLVVLTVAFGYPMLHDSYRLPDQKSGASAIPYDWGHQDEERQYALASATVPIVLNTKPVVQVAADEAAG